MKIFGGLNPIPAPDISDEGASQTFSQGICTSLRRPFLRTRPGWPKGQVHVRRRKVKKVSYLFLLSLALLAVASCTAKRYIDPAPTLQESDLVGVWGADYSIYQNKGWDWAKTTGFETLILRADGMYKQVYNDGKGHIREEKWKKWWLYRFPDGRVRLWLDGGCFFPLDVDTGFSPLTSSCGEVIYYSTNDDGTGHPLDLWEYGAGVLLYVQVPADNPGELLLRYPPVYDPDTPIIVTFRRLSTTVPTPDVLPILGDMRR